MDPRQLLRLEGLAVLAVALYAYWSLGGPWWLLVGLALAPDLGMLGYLVGPVRGSRSYNLMHTYTLPLALGTLGVLGDTRLAVLVAFVWAGHIGADRLFGYGLKYASGFTDTHLARQPAPVAILEG
ncbi:MAG: DUF4260 domain-containing protein [Natrialbaceae archaeon]|nr:DUF4260 domain-containing protein [Natrialbaceae archaeon]